MKVTSKVAPKFRSDDHEITIKVIVVFDHKACDQAMFKRWVAQGLDQLDLDEYVSGDPATDVACDLAGKTILIKVTND